LLYLIFYFSTLGSDQTKKENDVDCSEKLSHFLSIFGKRK